MSLYHLKEDETYYTLTEVLEVHFIEPEKPRRRSPIKIALSFIL